MVASDGRVVVCDFGVGRVIRPGDASTARAYDGHGGEWEELRYVGNRKLLDLPHFLFQASRTSMRPSY